MNTTLKTGIAIGVACGVWIFVNGITGWYKDPVMVNLFFLVILIEIGILVWGLKQSASEKSYGGQVITGTVASVIAGVILFFNSLLFTIVLFPNFFNEVETMQVTMMKSEGKSDEEISKVITEQKPNQTPMRSAMLGLVSTVGTGLVASLVIAAFVRKK
ncbi:MAG: DUF4199 domain-containing protein [Ignavibacteriales bacterium]|nr:DUF4199 domain-containing protein [Ignavibacteriales bacterium]